MPDEVQSAPQLVPRPRSAAPRRRHARQRSATALLMPSHLPDLLELFPGPPRGSMFPAFRDRGGLAENIEPERRADDAYAGPKRLRQSRGRQTGWAVRLQGQQQQRLAIPEARSISTSMTWPCNVMSAVFGCRSLGVSANVDEGGVEGAVAASGRHDDHLAHGGDDFSPGCDR